MTRQTIKNRINETLHEITKGIFHDDFWTPVNAAFRKLEKDGFSIDLTGTKYDHDSKGQPSAKTWTFEVPFGKKPLYGIITAHGAGTISNPLSSYDISAYVS